MWWLAILVMWLLLLIVPAAFIESNPRPWVRNMLRKGKGEN